MPRRFAFFAIRGQPVCLPGNCEPGSSVRCFQARQIV
jgi:hypothetical protein